LIAKSYKRRVFSKFFIFPIKWMDKHWGGRQRYGETSITRLRQRNKGHTNKYPNSKDNLIVITITFTCTWQETTRNMHILRQCLASYKTSLKTPIPNHPTPQTPPLKADSFLYSHVAHSLCALCYSVSPIISQEANNSQTECYFKLCRHERERG